MSNNKNIIIRKNILLFISIITVVLIIFLLIKYIYKIETISTLNKYNSIEIIKENNVDDYQDYINKLKSYFNNNDIVGRLNIPGAKIDSIVAQTNNNTYYLDHLINKKSNFAGSLFVDYRVDMNKDKQINIYGHNSRKYDIPFHRLENYLNKNFYDKNKYIYLGTEIGLSTYEIFSVKIVPTDYEEHAKFQYEDESKWYKHLKKLKEDSIYDTSVDIDKNDNVLILQTCNYTEKNKTLLLVIGKLV